MSRAGNMRASEEETLMDDYLASIGLHRKRVAKDGSCLFRAVAEQVLHSQSLHLQVRTQCVCFLRQHRESYEAFIEGDFEEYLQRLQDPQQWAGEVEMNALAVMFKRDFVIFQEPGKSPVDITGNKFKEKIQLIFLNGNHYDSVYPISHIKNSALCQSILYELLYTDVFQLNRHTVTSCQSRGRTSERLSDDSMAPCLSSDDSDSEAENLFRSNNSRMRGRGRGLMLPESVRRSLSESLYRNVAYDVWHKSKKAQLKQDYCMAAGMQYTVGQRCQVWLDGSEQSYNATIEEIPPDDGPVTIYTEEEGQLRVPLWSLRPVTSESPEWSPIHGRERRICNGQQEGPRGSGKSGPKSSGFRVGSSGRAYQQKSRAPHEDLRRYKRSSADTLSFGITSGEHLPKEKEQVEIHLKDELSFPALRSPLEVVGRRSLSAAETQKITPEPLHMGDASPSSVPSSNVPPPAPTSFPAPTFIAPIAPCPGATRAFVPRLSSPSPPVYPSSSSPVPPLPQVTDALRPSAQRPRKTWDLSDFPVKCPDAGDAGSVSVLHNQGSATMDPMAAQELKDRVADVGSKTWDPLPSQDLQVQSRPTPSPPISPTLQNPSENSPAHEALAAPSSGSPQLLPTSPFPLGQPPTLPGGILVHHLYQDPLYPGFPQEANGNVLPAPEFSLRTSGEDLPQDVNVLRFFFNLGVKAYTWPFYMPYLYLLPLQQAHIMQPRVQMPHCPPEAPLQPTCPSAAVPVQPGEPANGCGDAWPAPHRPAYQAAGSDMQTPQCAALPSYPQDPHANVLHRGSLHAFPVNAALAYNSGDNGMNAMPRPDIPPALGRAAPLAHIPPGGHRAPHHHPSVGCNTDEIDESAILRLGPSRHYRGRRPGGRGGYRRRRGREPGNYF
ncbi:OTU domain-containing protein 4 isoform X2 [Syngnathus acus]|uniref:OTU domain-containing protein 4 isoform X2 n=1 Tax=Syngnathus acus TaxID=161584 RepID=UPI001885E4EE|nr:OTU domain-containing protein 4 isoform X2 [Syngnathus acus]